jgi:hypothetical protein
MNQLCPFCGHSFEAAGENAPEALRCPACGESIRPAAAAPRRRLRIGARDLVIGLAVAGVLTLLALLFLQPSQPARDFVFGDLGRMPSATNNPARPPPSPPIPPRPPTPTSAATESPPPAASSLPRQPTPAEVSNALAAAMAAAPPVRSSADDAAAASATAPVVGPLPATAAPSRRNPATPPRRTVEPNIPPPPEPEDKVRTADLLKTEIDAVAATPTDSAPKALVPSDLTSAPSGAAAPPAEPQGGSTLFDPAAGKSVTFIFEQSSRMVKTGKSTFLRNELVKTLQAMGSSIFFNILVYHAGGDGFADSPSQGPIPATAYNIGRMTNWLISVPPRSGSDPSKAVRHVVDSKPPSDTIWLVSDGELSAKVVQAVHTANALATVPINTIGFQGQKGGEILRQIAAQNGGHCLLIPFP